MTSDRPYRTAMTKEQALETIRKYTGKQFHPKLSSIFLRIMARQDERTSPASPQG